MLPVLAIGIGLASVSTPAPLEVGLFGGPGELPISEAVWERSSISQQALLVSLGSELDQLGRRLPKGEGYPSAGALIEAIDKAIRGPHAKRDPGLFSDDSRFTGKEDYPQLARQALVRFYRKSAPESLPIDVAQVRVQLEVFGWKNASYRLDLFFAQKPDFVPLNSNFVMAHRMWMRRSGQIIRQESVYRTTNVEQGEDKSSVPVSRRGFFPGLSSFRAELDRIDAALRTAGTVGPVDVRRGIQDLERYGASIMETKSAFRVVLDSEQEVLQPLLMSPEFAPYQHVIFEIDKATGKLSPPRFEQYTPPAPE